MAQYIYLIPFYPVFQKPTLEIGGDALIPIFPGEGYISGKVIEGIEAKVGATIELYDCETKQFVKSTTTDVVGEYIFSNLDRGRYFDVIAVDPEMFWEKKISSYRKPKFDFAPVIMMGDGSSADISAIDTAP